jgi:hypothetical protein
MRANLNCELATILGIIYIRLYGRLCLVYVISLMTSMLLGNEKGMILVSWISESINQALDKEIDIYTDRL